MVLSATDPADSEAIGLGAGRIRDTRSYLLSGSIKIIDSVGDDNTNNDDAFAAALATNKDLFLPPGIHRTSTDIVLGQRKLFGVFGSASPASAIYTVIKPTNAVTNAIILNSSSELSGITIDGTLTTGKTGILIGDTSLALARLSRVRVQNFLGAGAYGIHHQGTYFMGDQLYVSGNNIGMLVDGTGKPTTSLFLSSAFRASTLQGVLVKRANGIHFINCPFEANGEEGFRIAPDAGGTAVNITLDRPWFEDNWLSNTPNTNYDFVANATSVGGVRTVQGVIRDPQFLTGSAYRLSIKLTGAGVTDFLVDHPLPSNQTGSILVESSATAKIANFPLHLQNVYTTIVNDAGNLVSNSDGIWKDYTPTYGSNIGPNESDTFNGAVTTSEARFKRDGKKGELHLNWFGILKAVTPAYITATLPTGWTAKSNNQSTGAWVKNNATGEGAVVVTSSGKLQFYRAALSTFTASQLVAGAVSITLELV